MYIYFLLEKKTPIGSCSYSSKSLSTKLFAILDFPKINLQIKRNYKYF